MPRQAVRTFVKDPVDRRRHIFRLGPLVAGTASNVSFIAPTDFALDRSSIFASNPRASISAEIPVRVARCFAKCLCLKIKIRGS